MMNALIATKKPEWFLGSLVVIITGISGTFSDTDANFAGSITAVQITDSRMEQTVE